MIKKQIKYLEPEGSRPAKRDQGKAQLNLVSPHFVEGMARVLQFAIEVGKYDRGSWLNGILFSQVIDAAERHILAMKKGEFYDPETGELHSYHAACNLMFLSHYISNQMHHLNDLLFIENKGDLHDGE